MRTILRVVSIMMIIIPMVSLAQDQPRDLALVEMLDASRGQPQGER